MDSPGSANTALALEPEPTAHLEPKLLPELESWGKSFLGNLRHTLFAGQPALLDLTSAPGQFWPGNILTSNRCVFNRAACHEQLSTGG